jgi:hypothetical protein
MKRFALTLAAVAAVAAVPLAGCDSSGSGAGPAFQLRMTDAPFPFETADSAVVTIRRIEIRGDDSTATFVLYDGPEVEYNLLDLQNGLDTTLALAQLPAGDFHQVRIIVAPDARVVMNDGTVFPLRVPSGAQTGIKINLPDIDLPEADTVDVLVDFDVERSFVTQGPAGSPNGFSFRPVLQIDSIYVDGVPLPREDFPEGGEGEVYEGG